ncbi:hypothetical protein V0288_16250 [Pannus brasiliensis CCIBt3594]|uniref:Uncharacterized protein n=1 Tax=Pannus brasiliensis CCIBt3594 TaxID=1427578 RepID=A0AAW9QYD9_9CHRO
MDSRKRKSLSERETGDSRREKVPSPEEPSFPPVRSSENTSRPPVRSLESPPISPVRLPERPKISPATNPQGERTIDWLNSLNIQVLKSRQPEPSDEVWDRVAWQLGENTKNPTFDSLYRQLKIGITQNTTRYLNCSGKSQKDLALCLDFVRFLKDRSFLNSYSYDKNNRTIRITPPENGTIRNFLTGGWLERYIHHKIIQYLEEKQIEYQCLANPELKFSNGDIFELDFLFLINDCPVWIECKSGQNFTNNNILNNYSRHQKKLQTGKENSILVIYNIADDQSVELGQLWNFTFVDQHNVLDALRSCFPDLTSESNGDISEKNEESEMDSVAIDTRSNPPKTISAILRQCNVRPSPDCRSIVLQELIELFSRSPQPLTRKEIRDVLYEKLMNREGISKSKIQEILTALARQKIFMDRNNHPVEEHESPIFSLFSLEMMFLERQCIEQYIRVILQHQPNFFNRAKNIQNFQEVSGTGYLEAEIRKIVLEVKDPSP